MSIGLNYFLRLLFSLAVLPELVNIAVNSSDSLWREFVRSLFNVSDSMINSSQRDDSSDSSSTMVIFEMKSAIDLALQADR